MRIARNTATSRSAISEISQKIPDGLKLQIIDQKLHTDTWNVISLTESTKVYMKCNLV
jgi:hypothetical protein